MEIIKTEVFELDELSESAQQVAVKNIRDDWNDPYWYAAIEDQWKEKLEGLGYNNADISFSGFSSQGDGASFTARVDLVKWVEVHGVGEWLTVLDQIRESDECEIEGKIIRIDNHYSHENTCRASIELFGKYSPEGEKKIADLEALIEADRLKLSREIYKEFESEYDYLQSDEVLRDESIAGNYKFLASGEIYHN